MNRDFTVKSYGTDPSGRTIYLTVFAHEWLEDRWAELGFRATIVQGAFMTRNGGGAQASAGYHDKAGCIDFRTRDLSKKQLDAMVKEFRDNGGALWRRDLTAKHGRMAPHAHLTLGADFPLSEGARISWHSYVTGGDGLAGPGRDYEYRPKPLVLDPPEDPLAALTADIKALAKKHNVTLVYVARVALRAAAVSLKAAGSKLRARRTAVASARAILKPFK